MQKGILIKFCQGKATVLEQKQVAHWVSQSPANKAYLVQLMDHLALVQMALVKPEDCDLQKAEAIVSKSNKPVMRLRRQLYFSRAVAAILFLTLILGGTWYYRSILKPQEALPEVFAQVPRGYLHTIYTNKGVKSQVVLPDSSVVILNSDSKIVFPDSFTGERREVYLEGEAYFNVTSNPEQPMFVSTNRHFIVKVLGTEFNVRSYANDNKAVTTLYKGSIELMVSNNKTHKLETHTLEPNEAFLIQDVQTDTTLPVTDVRDAKAWIQGTLIFDQTPMDQVIKELERWHGSRFVVTNEAIYERQFTATLHEESLVQIMEVLRYCSDIEYSIEGNTVTLSL